MHIVFFLLFSFTAGPYLHGMLKSRFVWGNHERLLSVLMLLKHAFHSQDMQPHLLWFESRVRIKG